MKTARLFLMIGFVVSLVSCNREKGELTLPTSKENDVYKRIIAAGFSKKDIVEHKDYYLVEGDIMFKKDDVNKLAPPLKQAYCGSLIDIQTYSVIKVYIDVDSFNSMGESIEGAAWGAINDYNQLYTGIVFYNTYNPSLADITISNGSGLGVSICGMGDFPSGGSPGANIYINESTLAQNNITDNSQLIFLIIHEMGHTIGLRHTNWESLGEDTAYQIDNTPSTDSYSVMNGGTCGNYFNGFTTYDNTAISTLYPWPYRK